ncbi:uncharacterized protein LOC110806972 [Carica papaya]|uniref:uncharacterized protein LOC110806972 n=1 Tax=Carica papaya TaxID=3649 RepID=UPI000B8C7779|nr:uncharacterized protein LOC110806972 [Carica papaya]XP_021887676.1 uncharacterized protein LOC110806972 [Carica papaya]XP_021887677.1 uncharacterized protein LOC110806972 [Carica papaya]XP_021887678.1 uncharacterized protein LOC110806972 [Carica papaya]
MDLNLNQEQIESPNVSMLRGGSSLHELETTNGCIEERIGRPEAVTSRMRQHERQIEAQTSHLPVNNSLEAAAANAHSDGSLLVEASGTNFQERPGENAKVTKRYSPDLVAKALGVDANGKNGRNIGGGFFDCNICFRMARDPVLTSCGHLFCWPCFYQFPCTYSNVKECPVCDGEVTDASIIPIYGNVGNDNNCQSKSNESCSEFPQRPQAQRVESARQQRIMQRVFPPIEERILQLRSIIGMMSDQNQSPDAGDANATSGRSNRLPTTERVGNQRRLPPRISRLILQRAASFSSLSSALSSAMDSAESLVDDLEAIVDSNNLRRSNQVSSHLIDRQLPSQFPAFVQPDSLTRDTAAAIDSTVSLLATSSSAVDIPANVVSLENQTTDTARDFNSRAASSSSSSRTMNELSGTSDVDAGISRLSRRRRVE